MTGLGELIFSLENPYTKEALRFEERKGEVKIAEHWIFYRFFYEHEISELSAWADEEGDRDGILNEEEQTRLFIAAYRAMFEAHEIDTPLDYEFYRDIILRVAAVNPAPVHYRRNH